MNPPLVPTDGIDNDPDRLASDVRSVEHEAPRRGWFAPWLEVGPVTGAPDGPLAGLTSAVKESFDLAGSRTGVGCPDWLASRSPAMRHASAVERIVGAGASVVGKTVCDEFFYGVTGINVHYGTPENVRAPGRLPGGSSSGSAAVVAAGAVDFALGGDTGGSVRVPASFCGTYGMRPTHGRVDATGTIPMAPSFDVVGWFASGPGLLRRVGSVLLDPNGVPSPIDRLILAEDALSEADESVSQVAQAFVRRAEGLLPRAEVTRVAAPGLDAWRESFRVVQAHEAWTTFGEFLTKASPKLSEVVSERFAFAASVDEQAAAEARRSAGRAKAEILGLLRHGTVVVLPTAPCIAPSRSASRQELDQLRIRIMRLTCISGLSGAPQLTVPAGRVDGCPVGVSLLGWPGGDESLLDLAVALSSVL